MLQRFNKHHTAQDTNLRTGTGWFRTGHMHMVVSNGEISTILCERTFQHKNVRGFSVNFWRGNTVGRPVINAIINLEDLATLIDVTDG